MIEQWRDVIGWEQFYEVSDVGRVRSKNRRIVVLNPWGEPGERNYRGRVLKCGIAANGYPLVSLTAPGRKRQYAYVHDLVTAAFIGPKPPGLEVCHNDGARHHNAPNNLRYDTRRANALDRRRHGTADGLKGEDAVAAKLTDEAVRRIRRLRPLVTLQKLADEYGVTTSSISAAEHRKTWGHIA